MAKTTTPQTAPRVAHRGLGRLCSLWAALVALTMTAAALAQPASPQGSGPQPSTAPATPTSPASAKAAGPQLVEMLDYDLGPGGVVKPGAMAAARLTLRLNDAEGARDVLVRLHMDDVDGDTALWERLVTLTAGVRQNVTLYLPVPWGASQNDVVLVTFHDANDAGEATGLIGDARLPLPLVAPTDATMIGLIGSAPVGLDQYQLEFPRQPNTTIDASHLRFRIVRGLNPATMPDRWFGLDGFNTLVWTEGEPSDLSAARARALTEWVRRGGQLAIVLPTLADVWLSPDANPISTLLPDATAERLDDVSLDPYRNVLTKPEYDGFDLPDDATVFTFEPATGARPADAACLIEGPDGCVVMRRIVGSGMVTVIGLPVTDRQLVGLRVLRADAFWHQLLGYRFDIPSPAALESTEFSSSLRSRGLLSDTPTRVDQVIPDSIARAGTAAAGLLLALAVFIVYWLLAGPVGFLLLRNKGREKRAWVAFLATTAVFAAIAWVGAKAISPGSASVAHVTVVDHVYGDTNEHVRAWGSVLLPNYGDRTVLAAFPDRPSDNENLIRPFASPEGDTLLTFPDARSYIADIEDPAELTVPARSTVKQFSADWRGPVRSGMPAPPTMDETPALSRRGQLTGSLVHNLPGRLTDVELFVVGPPFGERFLRDARRDPLRDRRLSMPRAPIARVGVGDWAPGSALDLTALGLNVFNLPQGNVLDAQGSPTRDDQLFFASFLGSIPQPDYLDGRGARRSRSYTAELTQDLELSRWTTQPALIVIGKLEPESLPPDQRVSIFATPAPGGPEREPRPLDAVSGDTIVRWIMPLDPMPLPVRGAQN